MFAKVFWLRRREVCRLENARAQKNQHYDYWLLSAASDGCLQCVRHFIEKDGMSAQVVSATQKYTLLDCAIWARDHNGNEGAEEVVTYLTNCFPNVEATSTSSTSRYQFSPLAGIRFGREEVKPRANSW